MAKTKSTPRAADTPTPTPVLSEKQRDDAKGTELPKASKTPEVPSAKERIEATQPRDAEPSTTEASDPEVGPTLEEQLARGDSNMIEPAGTPQNVGGQKHGGGGVRPASPNQIKPGQDNPQRSNRTAKPKEAPTAGRIVRYVAEPGGTAVAAMISSTHEGHDAVSDPKKLVEMGRDARFPLVATPDTVNLHAFTEDAARPVRFFEGLPYDADGNEGPSWHWPKREG